MTYPAPPPFGTPPTPVPPAPLPAPAPVRRGWPGAAKIAVAVLAATTIGAAAAGVILSSSAKSDTDDVKKELADVRADLDRTKSDLDQSKKDLAAAADVLQQTSADLQSAQSERDAALARVDALRALFPLDILDFTSSPLDGTYTLTIVGTPACTGYADNASACGINSLPSQLAVSQDATGGLVVSSNFFDAAPLRQDLVPFTASGRVLESVADLCGGATIETTYTVSISVGGVGLDADDHLDATTLFVDFEMGTSGSTACTATNRAVSFDAVAS